MGIGRVELENVKTALQLAPRGMTVTDVSEKLHISRNSAAKYLEILTIAGEIQMRTFGRSKIYRLSGKVPLATALSLSSELIVFIDGSLVVIEANDQFLHYIGRKRDEIVGRSLEEIDLDLLGHRDILLNIKDVLRGMEFFREISVVRGQDSHYFSVKLIPVSSRDLRPGIAVIYQNITARKKAEIALKESETRYRAVVEGQSDLILRVLPDMTISFVNEACCRYFDQKKADLLGRQFTGLLPPESRAMIVDRFLRLQNDAAVDAAVDIEVRSDGGLRWLNLTCRGIADAGGNVREYQIVARDVTERKQAEIALIESEKKLKAAFDQSPIGACILSLDYRFVRVNPEFCRITGYPEAALLSMAFQGLIHPEDRETDISLATDLAAGRTEQYCIEERCVRKDGRIIWLRKHARLVKDASGKPMYLLPMFEDITDRKRMEESLLLTQFSTDNATVGIIWADASGEIFYANDMVCRKLKYPRETLEGMKIWAINTSYDPEIWQARFEDVKKKHMMEYEGDHMTRDNKVIPIKVNVNYLQFGGKEYYCAYVRYP